MAKTLQRLVTTSSDPVQRYALDWLNAWQSPEVQQHRQEQAQRDCDCPGMSR